MFRSIYAFEQHRILGIDFDFGLQKQICQVVESWRRMGKRSYIAITNPHSVMLCRRDEEMRRATAGAGLVLPDGVGIIVASKVLGYGRRHRVTGPALMLEMCDEGRKFGHRHYFLGGAERVAEKLAERLAGLFPGMEVAGVYCPPFRQVSAEEDEEVVKRINAARADVVWVGLGAPKQERWMAQHVGRIEATAMVGVGAAFDFHSGNVPWAPLWVRKVGMEWAWRLMREPRRMWRRNVDSPLFLMHVMGQAAEEGAQKIMRSVGIGKGETGDGCTRAGRPHPGPLPVGEGGLADDAAVSAAFARAGARDEGRKNGVEVTVYAKSGAAVGQGMALRRAQD